MQPFPEPLCCSNPIATAFAAESIAFSYFDINGLRCALGVAVTSSREFNFFQHILLLKCGGASFVDKNNVLFYCSKGTRKLLHWGRVHEPLDARGGEGRGLGHGHDQFCMFFGQPRWLSC